MTVSGAESYTVTYSYDANNRLLEKYTKRGKIREYCRFRYDSNGNQISKERERFAPIGTAKATVGFQKKSDIEMFESRVYNGFNQAVCVFADNVRINYSYRPDGLRHSKEIFDYKTTQSTVYLWDGQNICAEQNANGILAKYLRGISPIARRQDNINQYYHFNAHGDVVQLGSVAYDYDAFGNQKNPDPNDSNPFRYCGEYFDKETNTLYLRARAYNSRTGRFTQEDPIRDGLNWYTYCLNNPIVFVDPLGLVAVDVQSYADTYSDSTVISNKHGGYTIRWKDKSFYLGADDERIFFNDGRMFVDDSVFIGHFGMGNEALVIYNDPYLTDNVSIRANLSFNKDAYNNFKNSTHVQIMMDGIQEHWTTTSRKDVSYNVDTHVRDATGIDGVNTISVNMNLGYGRANASWSRGYINMYKGDSRNSFLGMNFNYSKKDFMWSSAHEFGHILGVGDAYSSQNSTKVKSIFNNPGTKVQTFDITAVLWAAQNGRHYDWP